MKYQLHFTSFFPLLLLLESNHIRRTEIARNAVSNDTLSNKELFTLKSTFFHTNNFIYTSIYYLLICLLGIW